MGRHSPIGRSFAQSQHKSNRKAVSQARKRARPLVERSGHRVESIEQRLLLTTAAASVDVFAQFDGTLASASASVQIPLKLTRSNFTLAGGKTTLGFQLAAAPGAHLDPATVQILDA